MLLADYADADLNAVGTHILRSGIVHSLRMRLRAQEWIHRHPEILDERVVAPIVVVGMMRSGTTLLQRLLAADPRVRCAYGWEVIEVAPRLEHRFTGVDPRIAVSEVREAKSRELAPELFAIHPMYAREAEEEIVFLESGAHLPTYRSWLDEQDFGPAWPTRLSAPDAEVPAMAEAPTGCAREALGAQVTGSPRVSEPAGAQFPDLHIGHMQRDPRTTIASGASLNATLHAMRRWLAERPREVARPPYDLEAYGLRPEQIDERFTLYNKRFRPDAGE